MIFRQYNNNQTKNVFQVISRNVRNNVSVNLEFSNDSMPYRKNNKTHQFKSKLLLLPTGKGFSYFHTYPKTNAVS